MERLICQVLRLKSKQPRTLAEQRAMRQSLAVLASYYSSREWKEDFAADEAGLFPRRLSVASCQKTACGICYLDIKRMSVKERNRWMIFDD